MVESPLHNGLAYGEALHERFQLAEEEASFGASHTVPNRRINFR